MKKSIQYYILAVIVLLIAIGLGGLCGSFNAAVSKNNDALLFLWDTDNSFLSETYYVTTINSDNSTATMKALVRTSSTQIPYIKIVPKVYSEIFPYFYTEISSIQPKGINYTVVGKRNTYVCPLYEKCYITKSIKSPVKIYLDGKTYTYAHEIALSPHSFVSMYSLVIYALFSIGIIYLVITANEERKREKDNTSKQSS